MKAFKFYFFMSLFFISFNMTGCALSLDLESIKDDLRPKAYTKAIVNFGLEKINLMANENISIKPQTQSAANFKISPALPSGLSLNPLTGEISGSIDGVIPNLLNFEISFRDNQGVGGKTNLLIDSTQVSAVTLSRYPAQACILKQGEVFCWGHNANLKPLVNKNLPAKILGLGPVTKVSSARDFACALEASGKVLCWGYSEDGGLGAGEGIIYSESALPTKVDAAVKFVDISAGFYHMCAISDQAEAYCWGKGHVNQLGSGVKENSYQPLKSNYLLGHVQKISAGDGHTCAISTESEAWCWGLGSSGQLGFGSTATTLVAQPYRVVDANNIPLSDVNNIESGQVSTCATSATTTTGQLYCWGGSTYMFKSLGAGIYSKAQKIDGFEAVTSLSMGTVHMCLIQNELAYCGGKNPVGSLGTGDLLDTVLAPVNTTKKFSTVSVSSWSNPSYNNISCGFSTDKEVLCWGSNAKNIITPRENLSVAPIKVDLENLTSEVNKSGSNNICKIRNNKVYCAQANDYSKSYNLPTVWSESFQEIQGLPEGKTPFNLRAGPYQSCVLVGSTLENELWCWGYNGTGLRGDGTLVGSATPGKSSLVNIKDYHLGTHHTCAITHDNKVHCVGSNTSKQLGPNCSAVAGYEPNWCEVASNVKLFHTFGNTNCLVGLDNEVKCWGSIFGILTSELNKIPGIPSTEVIISMKTAGGMTCALAQSGNSYCFGDRVLSLKNQTVPTEYRGDTHNSFVPLDNVHAAKEIFVLAKGSYCILNEGGGLYCRGMNIQMPHFSLKEGFIPKLTQVALPFLISKIYHLHTDSACAQSTQNEIQCWGNQQDLNALQGISGKGIIQSPQVIGQF